MRESDHDYFRRRAEEERAVAERSNDPFARRAHLELAARYDDVAEATNSNVVRLEVAADERPARRTLSAFAAPRA